MMKTVFLKYRQHFIWMMIITGIGIMIPRLFDVKWQPLIQFVIIVACLLIYMYLEFSKEIAHKQLIEQYNNDAIEQQRMLASQRIMLELSNSMIQVNGFDALMDIILKKAIEMIPKAEFGSILVMNKDEKLEFKAMVGFDPELFKVQLDPRESYQWAATGGVFKGPIIIEDLKQYSKEVIDDENFQSMSEMGALNLKSSLSAPILIDGAYFGSINVDSQENNMFGDEDANLMAYFANQATIAIINHQLYEKMLHLSRYDSLTKVYNRGYFETLFAKAIKDHIADQMKMTVALLDLDGFKQVNDLYGHNYGDKVLKCFAELFKNSVGSQDLFARYGGDEFVAVFYNRDTASTEMLMTKIHSEIIQCPIHVSESNKDIYHKFSYGMAEFPREAENLKDLIHIADGRMYVQKRA